MKLVVIIPVGPGHAECAQSAIDSAWCAWQYAHGPFQAFDVAVVDDTHGQRGRSAARNGGMDTHPADWHFLLDADDLMVDAALSRVDLESAATFGSIYLDNGKLRKDIWPLRRNMLFTHGPVGTLSMGCFVRGDLGLRFDESLDIGEDFDFYMRLPSFTKVKKPLVQISYTNHKSAVGPRAAVGDWVTAANKRIQLYREDAKCK